MLISASTKTMVLVEHCGAILSSEKDYCTETGGLKCSEAVGIYSSFWRVRYVSIQPFILLPNPILLIKTHKWWLQFK